MTVYEIAGDHGKKAQAFRVKGGIFVVAYVSICQNTKRREFANVLVKSLDEATVWAKQKVA
jgi:hypothetical protein